MPLGKLPDGKILIPGLVTRHTCGRGEERAYLRRIDPHRHVVHESGARGAAANDTPKMT
jgi:hypothetical protein